MCFFSHLERQQKLKQGTGGVSDGWNKVTSERNMCSAELGLNFRIMRIYAHGKPCTWLRNSYNCEWTCGSGWCGDEVPVSLPPLPVQTGVRRIWMKGIMSFKHIPASLSGILLAVCVSLVLIKHSIKSSRLWNQFDVVYQSNSNIPWSAQPKRIFS